MNIAIASGKGGTGKTTIATNLARTLSGQDVPVTYLDCDVEEPNGHIFLKPETLSYKKVHIPVPEVYTEKCTLCGQCANICQYSAIIKLADKILTFHELCHGCGGCMHVCPAKAITETGREIGIIETGRAEAVRFVHGKLHIGQVMSPPLIRIVKEYALGEGVFIYDAPPGTSCPVIESIRGADYTVLVTEPTPFGLHDLKLAVDMLRELKQPFGIAINRDGMGNDEVDKYCADHSLPVLLRLPDDRQIAEAYSRGEMAVDALPQYRQVFETLFTEIKNRCAGRS